MILAHASWHASSSSLAHSIAPPSLSARSPLAPTLVHLDSFHPRLSRRARWAVTKIDFCKDGRRGEREIDREYIAVESQFRLLGFGRRARYMSPFLFVFLLLAFSRPLPSVSLVKFSARLIKKKHASCAAADAAADATRYATLRRAVIRRVLVNRRS